MNKTWSYFFFAYTLLAIVPSGGIGVKKNEKRIETEKDRNKQRDDD